MKTTYKEVSNHLTETLLLSFILIYYRNKTLLKYGNNIWSYTKMINNKRVDQIIYIFLKSLSFITF